MSYELSPQISGGDFPVGCVSRMWGVFLTSPPSVGEKSWVRIVGLNSTGGNGGEMWKVG